MPYIVFGNEGTEQCRCQTSFRYFTFLFPKHKNTDLEWHISSDQRCFYISILFLTVDRSRCLGKSITGHADS